MSAVSKLLFRLCGTSIPIMTTSGVNHLLFHLALQSLQGITIGNERRRNSLGFNKETLIGMFKLFHHCYVLCLSVTLCIAKYKRSFLRCPCTRQSLLMITHHLIGMCISIGSITCNLNFQLKCIDTHMAIVCEV